MALPPAIVADDVENPGNVETLLVAAEMFCSTCVFHAHAHLARADLTDALNNHRSRIVTSDEIGMQFRPLLALENVSGAAELYGFRFPTGPTPALVVGNERRGISRELLTLSDRAVQIPMPSPHLNSLNVASAAAVGLYYLNRNGGAGARVSAHPEKRRPELLLLAPTDHVELGSSIRSASAFGWQQLLVDDRYGAWFGVPRATRAEGRAAARRARNPIHVIPSSPAHSYAFEEICVVSPEAGGVPLAEANLAGGHRQLLVIPDIQGISIDHIDWSRFGGRVSFVSLDLPVRPASRRYRLDASIVLAETAHQIGRPSAGVARKHPSRAPRYDRILRLGASDLGQLVFVDELECY